MKVKYNVTIHAGQALSYFYMWTDGTFTQSVIAFTEDGEVKSRMEYTYTTKEEWKQAIKETAELSVLLV